MMLSNENNDEETFKKIIKDYAAPLYNFTARLTNQNDAPDIVQEVFIKVWKNLKRFDPAKASFKTWIFTITKNTTTDFLRKKKSLLFSDFDKPARQDLADVSENTFEQNIPDENLLPDEILQKLEEKTADIKYLNEILEKINPIYREVLILHYQEEMTFEEIGKILNKPLNTIKSQHRRALLELRKIISASPL